MRINYKQIRQIDAEGPKRKFGSINLFCHFQKHPGFEKFSLIGEIKKVACPENPISTQNQWLFDSLNVTNAF